MPEENNMTKEERNGLARSLILALEAKGYNQYEIGAFIGRSQPKVSKIKYGKYNATSNDVRQLLLADVENPALNRKPRNSNWHSYVYSACFPTEMKEDEIVAKVLSEKQAKKVLVVENLGVLTLAGNGDVQHLRLRVWHESQDIRSKKS